MHITRRGADAVRVERVELVADHVGEGFAVGAGGLQHGIVDVHRIGDA